MKNAFDTLMERGFIKQVTFPDELRALLGEKGVPFYCGFDPTADSLHIGHYIPVMAMAHMQRAGHTPIVLVGGGTAMVGDPSNRNDMRNLMDKETIKRNADLFKMQLSKFVSFDGKNAAIVVDNADWLTNLNYIDFLRDIGSHFSVNRMLAAECFRSRLKTGLSFLEFNYMLMQAYDFLMLFEKYGCSLQVGGNDQWSNILEGADLIRRLKRKSAFALTFALLETSNGEKMGKTQKGALWLDERKTTPYEFYQYFRNVEDVKVRECLNLLTFLENVEINELLKGNINDAKKRLAYEVTALIHGKEKAGKAQNEAVAAFSGNMESMPTIKIAGQLDLLMPDLLVMAGLASSRSEARRLIEGGGVKVNSEKVSKVDTPLNTMTKTPEFVLHKGKKVHVKIVINQK
ncbi:MAG: tyrosine--tRNA ligase [Firmicutes bacterium]|nr:tyrosine--tRNA ligase [Bacillota bacterium]